MRKANINIITKRGTLVIEREGPLYEERLNSWASTVGDWKISLPDAESRGWFFQFENEFDFDKNLYNKYLYRSPFPFRRK